MNLPLAFGSFLFFTALVPLIAWWLTRHRDNTDARTFFLADRSLPWFQIAGTLLLTNLSTEQLIGLNGAASIHGAVVMAWEVVPVVALIAMAYYFLPRYWSGNITTIPEFLESRFDRGTRRLLGIIVLAALTFNFMPFVLYSGGIAMGSIFHLHDVLGISPELSFFAMAALITVLSGAYAILGGMSAVALSDTLYGVGLLTGALVIPVLGLAYLGEGDIATGFGRVLAHQPAKLNPVGGPGANVPFSTLFTGMLLTNMYYWCTNQLMVQRSFGAKSYAEAQKGLLATAGLKLVGPLFLVFPGIIAAEAFGASIGNGDLAYARLVDAVLPTWMIGFFAAVLLGAVISSFNSGLHTAATLFGYDLYKAWIRPQCTDNQMVRAGKIFGVIICVASLAASPLLSGAPEGVFTLMKRLMAAFNIPILAVVVIGLATARVPPLAAKTALVGGVGLHFLLLWCSDSGVFGFQLHWLHVIAINFALLCLWMLGGARFFPSRPTASPVLATGAGVLTPWRHLRLASWLLVIATVGLYAILWWLARGR
ncbi:MAG: solute:sodium symporter family transporter [Opitutaceae bacterium]|nr:solute:sodium symporter family transporter [Opitutaceae bacterium]